MDREKVKNEKREMRIMSTTPLKMKRKEEKIIKKSDKEKLVKKEKRRKRKNKN